MDAVSIIEKRRDAKKHTQPELDYLVKGASDGTIPDYQLAAWLMAAYLKPLDADETALLTIAMSKSGVKVDLTGVPKPWVDKHSTGGVGDKTTLVLLPLLCACGLTMVKMSGRGLGITGGTVDKLASVPGFRTDLSAEELRAQAAEIGIALTGQSPNLAPADKVLYALRDVTGTVSSIPLIVSSILSKKIAGGAQTLVLDVKCGSGAFMKRAQEARALAAMLQETAEAVPIRTKVVISDMSQPLGSTVGNALEVREAFRVLRNEHLNGCERRFRELCLHLATVTLMAALPGMTLEDAQAKAQTTLISGAAAEKAEQWFRAQGADLKAKLPAAPVNHTVLHRSDGAYVTRIDAETIGRAVLHLGGGRKTKDDLIDPSVGLELHVKVGDRVEKDQPLVTIHARNEGGVHQAVTDVLKAMGFAPFEVPSPDLFIAEQGS